MTEKTTCFITGAGRDMGADIARAALAAGHAVVATGRNPDPVSEAVGEADDLLAVTLDITNRQDAEAAVQGSAYAASKFAVEGWMESLQPEVEPFGIATTIVEPGFFRTELLEPESTTWPELSIDDYAEPPLRFMAGADSIELAEQKVAALAQQIDAVRELSTTLALDDLDLTATGS